MDPAGQLARPSRQSCIGAAPKDSVPHEERIRIQLRRRLRNVPPVRPIRRAIVGSDRGAVASRELRCELLTSVSGLSLKLGRGRSGSFAIRPSNG